MKYFKRVHQIEIFPINFTYSTSKNYFEMCTKKKKESVKKKKNNEKNGFFYIKKISTQIFSRFLQNLCKNNKYF